VDSIDYYCYWLLIVANYYCGDPVDWTQLNCDIGQLILVRWAQLIDQLMTLLCCYWLLDGIIVNYWKLLDNYCCCWLLLLLDSWTIVDNDPNWLTVIVYCYWPSWRRLTQTDGRTPDPAQADEGQWQTVASWPQWPGPGSWTAQATQAQAQTGQLDWTQPQTQPERPDPVTQSLTDEPIDWPNWPVGRRTQLSPDIVLTQPIGGQTQLLANPDLVIGPIVNCDDSWQPSIVIIIDYWPRLTVIVIIISDWHWMTQPSGRLTDPARTIVIVVCDGWPYWPNDPMTQAQTVDIGRYWTQWLTQLIDYCWTQLLNPVLLLLLDHGIVVDVDWLLLTIWR